MDILPNSWTAGVEGEMEPNEAGEGGRSRLVMKELRAMEAPLGFR